MATLRFAPSPTGYLHIGNVRTALLNAALAARGGTFVLRLDDTDATRSEERFADAIREDLAWLGIEPDRTVRQSDRLDAYDEALERLKADGLVYPCYETPEELERRRKRLMARGRPPIYDRAALKLTDEERERYECEGRAPHYRFLLPNHGGDPFEPRRTEVHWEDLVLGRQTVDLGSLSDPVLVRAEGTYLYTLPSVVDDAELGVTDVVRGADHVTNTGVQIALFEALGHAVPRFGHHNLLLDAAGEGLSKRIGSLSIRELRADGYEPEAVIGLAALTGTSQDVRPILLTKLAEVFDPHHVSPSPARLSPDELDALNRTVLHEMPYAQARSRLGERNCDLGEAFWNTVRANLDRFGDVEGWKEIVAGHGPRPEFDADEQEFLSQAAARLPDPLNESSWSAWTGTLRERTGRKGRALFMPLRRALTGLDHGPELADLLPLMDRAVVLARLRGQPPLK